MTPELCDRCLARPSDDWPAPEGSLCRQCRDAELDAAYLDDLGRLLRFRHPVVSRPSMRLASVMSHGNGPRTHETASQRVDLAGSSRWIP